jgi:hypothetical protein
MRTGEVDAESATDAVRRIVDAVRRRMAGFALVRHGGTVMLLAGSHRVLSGPGYIVSMQLTREQLRELRDTCDALLKSES